MPPGAETVLCPYEMLAPIGAGRMGEVIRPAAPNWSAVLRSKSCPRHSRPFEVRSGADAVAGANRTAVIPLDGSQLVIAARGLECAQKP